MRILLVGATGQLGWELRRALQPLGPVAAPTRERLDLTREDSVRAAVGDREPDLVVNAAAASDVDGAEESPGRAEAVNAEGPALLAETADRAGAALVHYSTDYVFGGEEDRSAPYTERDAPAPVNVYGETKLHGERAVRESGVRHLVFRTSWLYGLRRSNFLRTMREQFRGRDEVRVVEDQVGTPNWARLVAEATALALTRCRDLDDPWGLYHLTARGEASRLEWARAIRAREPDPGELAAERITGITAEAFDAPAPRPDYSALDPTRFEETFGLEMPAWTVPLDRCMEEA